MMKKTKIICTLGPASSSEEVIEKMLLAGMNVARFNFSHGTHEYHKKSIETFRRVRDRLKIPAAVLLDTKGPEIRVGEVANNGAELKRGQTFTLTTESVIGNAERVSISYADLPSQLSAGQTVLMDDGMIILKVKDTTEKEVICEVVEGGVIKTHKGVNVPNVSLNMPYMSPADESDVLFGIEMGVDFIAASFVRSAKDVITLRKFVDFHGGHNIKIISKIENIEGIRNFDEILRHSDGIMVARGDMGVEVEFEKLPGLQKRFIKQCYRAGKMVITATQMLESMINNYSPTRAEITDVANAVFDGTSAVMLSGETTIGVNPVRVVEVMARIIKQAEADAFEMGAFDGITYENNKHDVTNAICDAACTTASDLKAKAIIVVTKSGKAARGVSKFRPHEPIIAATPELKTFHQLSLSWGVTPVHSIMQKDADALFIHAVDCAKQIDVVSAGDIVVITSGIPVTISGTTNILKVTQVN
jgi:pyruvate kinase